MFASSMAFMQYLCHPKNALGNINEGRNKLPRPSTPNQNFWMKPWLFSSAANEIEKLHVFSRILILIQHKHYFYDKIKYLCFKIKDECLISIPSFSSSSEVHCPSRIKLGHDQSATWWWSVSILARERSCP